MSNYTIYNETNAPEAAREALTGVKGAFGFIPNLLGTMAEAPSLLKGYLQLTDLLQASSLSAQEQRLITLAISAENNCHYCVAAEGLLSHKMANIDIDVVRAVQEGRPLADNKLNALIIFARDVAGSRGYPSEQNTQAFLAAGYTKANILEVVLANALKVISNYTNHIANTEVDGVFAEYVPSAQQAA